MATSQADAKDRQFLAVIGDEVSFDFATIIVTIKVLTII